MIRRFRVFLIQMAALKLLQINLNRSREAQLLIAKTAQDLNIDIVLISEPNLNTMPRKWLRDEAGSVALWVRRGGLKLSGMRSGPGYVAVSTEYGTVVSVYYSPNITFDEYTARLDSLKSQLLDLGSRYIVGGDFNSKSPLWGSAWEDRRGAALAELMATLDAVPLNIGTEPTFVRGTSRSVIDVTFSSPGIAAQVSEWSVLETESLSDHRYVYVKVAPADGRVPNGSNAGWADRQIDDRALISALSDIFPTDEPVSADELVQGVVAICNRLLPRRGGRHPGGPVYWWSRAVAEKRAACNSARRQYQRSLRRQLSDCRERHRIYLSARREYKLSIKASKRKCTENLICDIENNPWGLGYKLALGKLRGRPPVLSDAEREGIEQALFPNPERAETAEVRSRPTVPPVAVPEFTLAELRKAMSATKTGKAPGPDMIPASVVLAISRLRPWLILGCFNACLRESIFPRCWKKARLVLIPKAGKPPGNPSSYRPLCLIDSLGKLFGNMLLGRLNAELDRTGGLSERQYGFRKGRSTVDALKRIDMLCCRAYEGPVRGRRYCAVVALDVRNAFNSALWEAILSELGRRDIAQYLQNIIASYLSDRVIVVERSTGEEEREVFCGVPQGDVLGPTLWNVVYDPVADIALPTGVEMAVYADDKTLVVAAKHISRVVSLVEECFRRIHAALARRGLSLAPEKTEIIFVTGRRRVREVTFNLGGVVVTPGQTLRSLGVTLDRRGTFGQHVLDSVRKATVAEAAISRLMPRCWGSGSARRRLIGSVVESVVMYAAPVWARALRYACYRTKLLSLQRRVAIRVASAYGTVSGCAALVVAGMIPLDLLAARSAESWRRSTDGEAVDAAEERAGVVREWQTRWDTSTKGRWTHRLIPNVKLWIDRKHGQIDYYTCQGLTGHGCFGQYLLTIGKRATDECGYCGECDTAEHTLFSCRRWVDERHILEETIGVHLTPDNFVSSMLGSEDTWNRVQKYVVLILKQKIEDERYVGPTDGYFNSV